MMSVQEAEEQTAAALSAQIAISQLQAEIQVALKKAAPAAAVVGCGGSKGGRGGTAGVLMPASGSAPGAQAEEDLLVDSTAVTTTVSTTAACATVASCLPHELISLILSLAATASSTSAAFDVYSARLLLLIPQKSLKDTSDSYSASPLATLFSCSLVCRAWCLAAMPLIYNHREFNKNGGGGGGFKFTLKDDNHTLAFIRGLSYYTAFSANKEEQETTVLLDRLSSITSLAFPSSKLAGCLIGTTSKLLFPALKQ